MKKVKIIFDNNLSIIGQNQPIVDIFSKFRKDSPCDAQG